MKLRQVASVLEVQQTESRTPVLCRCHGRRRLYWRGWTVPLEATEGVGKKGKGAGFGDNVGSGRTNITLRTD